ncbi:MAG: TonB-dependent receptor [Sphingobium sp.]|nr:TonB-dependent receptor [Sphingobium sp.]
MTTHAMRLRRTLACSTGILVFFSCNAAYAQTASDNDSTGHEIIVTALKRETRLQDTPLSISAVGGETLLKQGASSATDMIRQVPGLNMTETNTSQRRISIRGVQSAGESTVGLYLGETPVSGPNSATSDPSSITPDLNLFDVARVEVLRGPQGTLYGSGSMSGTFKLIFNEPNSNEYAGAFDGSISDIKGGGMNYSTRGMVNIPLVEDVLGFRAVGFYDRRAGFVDNVVLNQKDVNSARSYGGRFMLQLTPATGVKINATAILQEQESHDSPMWFPAVGKYKTDAEHKQPFPNSFRLYSLNGEADLGFATLTASGSRYTWDGTKYIDGTRSARAAGDRYAYCSRYFNVTGACTDAQKQEYKDWVYSLLPLSGYQPMKVGAWVWEGRLSGTSGKWLDWTVGIFRESRSDSAVSSTVEADGVTGLVKFPIVYNFSRSIDVSLKQTAFFGEATVRPVEGLNITGGLRRYSYKKESTGQVLSTSYINASIAGPPLTTNADASGWVTKINVSYEPTRDIMVYAQRSEGFRPGGLNNTPGLPDDLIAYTSDSLTNYEMGIKTSWFDRKVTFNVSAYQIDWKNMQISAAIPNFNFITNVGASRIRGTEVEFAAYLVEGLSINGNMAFQRGKLRTDQINGVVTAAGKKGDRIPNEPSFTAAVGAEYGWAASDAVDAFVRMDYSYTGKSNSEFRPNSPIFEKMGNFSMVNARAGIEYADWNVSVFINNLFDKTGLIRVSSNTFSNLEQATISSTPRTVGLSVRRNF